MLLSLVALLATAAAAAARPADQTVFGAPAPPSPPRPAGGAPSSSSSPLHHDSHGSTFSPLLPPAIPLAVKSPCASLPSAPCPLSCFADAPPSPRRPQRLALGRRRRGRQGLPRRLLGPPLARPLRRVAARPPPLLGRPDPHQRRGVRVPRRAPLGLLVVPRVRQGRAPDELYLHGDALHLLVRGGRPRLQRDLPLARYAQRRRAPVAPLLVPRRRRRQARARQPLRLGLHRHLGRVGDGRLERGPGTSLSLPPASSVHSN